MLLFKLIIENTYVCIICASYWPTVTKIPLHVHLIFTNWQLHPCFDLHFDVTGVKIKNPRLDQLGGTNHNRWTQIQITSSRRHDVPVKYVLCAVYSAQFLCYWRRKTPMTLKSGFRMGQVIESYTSQFVMCHFLLVINCTRGRIFHRLWDTAFDRSTITLFCYPSCI